MTVLIGDPVEFDDLLDSEGTGLASRENLYDAVSARVGQRLNELKVQVDELAFEKPRKMKEYALEGIDRAAEILQQLDWESFGMSSYTSYPDEIQLSESERQNEEVVLSHQVESFTNYSNRTGITDGILSRIQRFVNTSECMGFAARGALLNQLNRGPGDYRQLNPLRAWKQYLEASYGARVHLC